MSKQAQTSQHSPVNLNYITPQRQQYLPVRGRRLHRDELIFKSAEGSNGHFKSMKRLAPNLSQKINMYHANKNQNMVNKMNIFELDNSAPEQYTKKAQALVNQYRQRTRYLEDFPESLQTSQRRIPDYRAGHVSPDNRAVHQKRLEQ